MHACPYLRPVPNGGAVCTARLPASVPESAYRAAVCLTLRHRQCPRLPGGDAARKAASPQARASAHESHTQLHDPAHKVSPAAPQPKARRAGGRRRHSLVVTASLALFSCLLLALVLTIAIVYSPQIGRALESTAQLARSTPIAPGVSEPAPILSPTVEIDALASAASSPTPPATSTNSPLATAHRSAVPTPTPLDTATVEPSPTPEPATATPKPPTPTPIPLPTGSPPTRLVIPAIQLDTPIHPVGPITIARGGKKMVIWDTLHDVASFHETSAYPGTGGNVVINGHRDIYGSVFLHLNKVRRGDQITVYAGELTYLYEVVEILEIPYVNASPEDMAEQLRLIGPTKEERLTILTCTPVGKATHRMYVLAEPLSSDRRDLIAR